MSNTFINIGGVLYPISDTGLHTLQGDSTLPGGPPELQEGQLLYDPNAAGQPGSELDDLSDVEAPTPANGDQLTWDSAQGLWVAALNNDVGILYFDTTGDRDAALPTPELGATCTIPHSAGPPALWIWVGTYWARFMYVEATGGIVFKQDPAGGVGDGTMRMANKSDSAQVRCAETQIEITGAMVSNSHITSTAGTIKGVSVESTGSGMYYTGSTLVGSANAMGLRWSGSILGTVDNVVSAVLGTPSDRRLKRDIEPLTDGLAMIEQLNPVSYKHRHMEIEDGLPVVTDGGNDDVVCGLIADEVEPLFPGLVEGEATDTSFQSVNYAVLVAPLIAAVQQLTARIEELENR